MFDLRKLSLTLGIALLAACATAPPKGRETAPTLPVEWDAQPVADSTADALPREWWTLFGDSTLDALVREARAANPDVAAAAARVAEARAIAAITRADRLPSFGVEAQASRAKTSELGAFPGVPATQLNTFRVAGVVSYEADLWGQYAKASAADRERLFAAEWNAEAVRLSLEAEVVRSVYASRAAILQWRTATASVEDRTAALELEQLRTDAGEGSELSLRQAEAELEDARVTRARAELDRDTELRALGVLLGRPPVQLQAATIESSIGGIALPEAPQVPAGLPATVIERRPDLLEAEAQLAAARYDVGAARAALLPAITLTGSYGNESLELSDLFKSGATAWSAAALLVQPIFEGGRRRAAVGRARALQDQRLADYQRAVIVAFREVFDALQAQRVLGEVRAARSRQIVALERSVELADLRYREGYSSYLDLLDARRNLLSAQLDLIDSERAQLAAAVDLVLALGGGTAP